jgi:hypothetical protein
MAPDVARAGNACRPDTASSLRTDRVAYGSTLRQSAPEHDVGNDE